MRRIYLEHGKRFPEYKRLLRILYVAFSCFLLGTNIMRGELTYARQTLLTLSFNNVELEEVFNSIRQQSEFEFFYSNDQVDTSIKTSIHVEKADIYYVLKRILPTDYEYEINDRYVLISKAKSKTPVVSSVSQQQGRTVTGVVRDASGPVIGANVVVKGTTNGTVTNVDGQFTITNVPANAVLQASFIGYRPTEVSVGNQTRLEITLSEDVEMLEEVVVVGYGTMQKKDVTGSVGQVQSGQISSLAAPRIDQALVGQLAGVQVISTTGQPGEGLNIRVRGVGSISAGTQPLYVIDGFPDADIQMLSPDDIASIDILKDASATAIYGSRGANGVVMITTKRGKEGKSTINLDVYYGWQNVLREPKFLTMQQQAQYYYDGIVNQNKDENRDMSNSDPTKWYYPVPKTVLNVLNGTINESHDAFKYIFQTAPQQNYSLSVRGGNKDLKYAVSGSYMSQDGIIIMSDFNRYTVRANIDAQVNQWVSMKFNITSSYATSRNIRAYGGSGDAEGILGAATTWQYWYPLYTEDGNYFSGYGQDATNNVWNPMAQANEIKRKNEQYNTLGNFVTDIKITKDLNLNINLGATNSNTRAYYFIPKLAVFNNTAEGRDDRSNSLAWITESMLTYQKKFNNHSLNVMAAYTTQQYYFSDNYVMSRNYPNNMVYTLNAASNPKTEGSSEEGKWTLLSYLARVNYNYNSKYYLTASIRADGSSRFGRDRKYGYFPSAAIRWRASEEKFLKEIAQINDLSLRASYGVTGNNDIGNYAHLATVSYPSYAQFGGGMAPANIENTMLTWEKQSSINFGFDISLFNNRIGLTGDYYITKNRDLLLDVDVPRITGFNTSLQNIGEVANKGWEFSLNTHNLTGVVEWNTNFNISAYRNKVLKLGPEGAPLRNTNHITQIGEPMGMFYGYKTNGIFKTQAEVAAGPLYGTGTADQSRVGDIRFVDINGDGRITTDDRTILGSPYPKFYYGMTNNISYRNFMLSCSLTGSYGNKVFNGDDMQMYTRARYKQYSFVYDYWKSESDPGTMPRPNNLPKGGLREKSDRYMFDGSFMRINNINLSYTLPKRIVQAIYLTNLRVYAASNNPFIFTNFVDFNPEVSNSSDPRTPGQMNYNYPIARSFYFGINVSF